MQNVKLRIWLYLVQFVVKKYRNFTFPWKHLVFLQIKFGKMTHFPLIKKNNFLKTNDSVVEMNVLISRNFSKNCEKQIFSITSVQNWIYLLSPYFVKNSVRSTKLVLNLHSNCFHEIFLQWEKIYLALHIVKITEI